MVHIHTLLIGKPQTYTDEKGSWQSSIFRSPVTGPVELLLNGLAGDQVTDQVNHGSPDQAVCCHSLEHYAYWNSAYAFQEPAVTFGPGSLGENWTISGATEADLCIGDIFAVGSAQIQITGPRIPCSKQERKMRLADFSQRTLKNLRTGFYVRVLTPGSVQAGDEWLLKGRPQPDLTIHLMNVCAHHEFDPELAQRLIDTSELGASWKKVFSRKLAKTK